MTLIDAYGRKISYLRVSLTEKCNLRCGYCYGGGSCRDGREKGISGNDTMRLIRAFSLLGVNKIRFTGGEPLLKKGIVDLVAETSSVEPIEIIGLTTNGVELNSKLGKLIDAGLNRLNVSLDSLNPDIYKQITGSAGLNRVLDAIKNAESSGRFDYVKVNVVVMKGVNDSEVPEFVQWALPRRIDIRFIEFMPVSKSGWRDRLFMAEDEIMARVGIDLEPIPINETSAGPAKTYRCSGYPGRISFISAVSRGFCDGCNRLRLTSDGRLLGCLFGAGEVDLKPLLGGPGSSASLATAIKEAVIKTGFRKPPDKSIFNCLEPSMRGIGG